MCGFDSARLGKAHEFDLRAERQLLARKRQHEDEVFVTLGGRAKQVVAALHFERRPRDCVDNLGRIKNAVMRLDQFVGSNLQVRVDTRRTLVSRIAMVGQGVNSVIAVRVVSKFQGRPESLILPSRVDRAKWLD
jgi:hypothetical protein